MPNQEVAEPMKHYEMIHYHLKEDLRLIQQQTLALMLKNMNKDISDLTPQQIMKYKNLEARAKELYVKAKANLDSILTTIGEPLDELN